MQDFNIEIVYKKDLKDLIIRNKTTSDIIANVTSIKDVLTCLKLFIDNHYCE